MTETRMHSRRTAVTRARRRHVSDAVIAAYIREISTRDRAKVEFASATIRPHAS